MAYRTWESLTHAERLFYTLGVTRGFTMLIGIGLLLLLKRHQYRARHGDVRSARAVLLPVYEPLIVLMICGLAIEFLILALNHFSQGFGLKNIVIISQASLELYIHVGLVAFFCSPSLSSFTLLRSVFFAFMTGFYGFITSVIYISASPLVGFVLLYVLPILCLIAILKKVVYRRRSIVPYLKFMIFYYCMWTAYGVCEIVDEPIAYAIVLVCIGILELPLSVIWYGIMWRDTQYWRSGGIGTDKRGKNKNKFLRHLKRMIKRGCLGKKPKLKSSPSLPQSKSLNLNGHLLDGDNITHIQVSSSFTPSDATFHDGVDPYDHSDFDNSDSEWDDDDDDSVESSEKAADWEHEAMERIRMLRDQDEEYERAHQYHQAAAHRLQQEQSFNRSVSERRHSSGDSAGSGGSGGSGAESHAPSMTTTANDLSCVASTVDSTFTEVPHQQHLPHPPHPPAPSSTHQSSIASSQQPMPASPRGPRPKYRPPQLPMEPLLESGSDQLLSKDIQQLIEANKNRFINFALLRMDSATVIGRGGSSNVYAGYYRNYPVALKFFKREAGDEEITSESIAAYAKETAIAAAFNHPSIVKFIGLCVRPPTIFLVTELCPGGSLFNALPQLHAHPAWCYQALLTYAIQASCSVAYLHSVGFIHRDIKSLNYLLSRRGQLKLSDFGLSRMFPQYVKHRATPSSSSSSSPPQMNHNSFIPPHSSRPINITHSSLPYETPPRSYTSIAAALDRIEPGHTPLMSIPRSYINKVNANHMGSLATQPSSAASVTHSFRNHIPSMASNRGGAGIGVGTPTHVPPALLTRQVGSRCWMSYEMLHGDRYSLSSDVYSLCMVLFELLVCAPPYHDVPDEHLNEVLLNGVLPTIPDWTPPEYADLLRRGWHRDASARPTAKQVHQTLVKLLEAHEREYQLEPFDSSVFFQPYEQTQQSQSHPPPPQNDHSYIPVHNEMPISDRILEESLLGYDSTSTQV